MDENLDELNKLEEMKRIVMKRILSKDALERLGRIRLVKPELAAQLELYLIQLYQEGKVKGEVTDKQIVMLLNSLTERKEYKIIK
jgi:programmed cell death protein 5